MSEALRKFLTIAQTPLSNLQKYACEHPSPTSVAELNDEYAEFGRLQLAVVQPLVGLERRLLKDSSFIPPGKTKESVTEAERKEQKAKAIAEMKRVQHWEDIKATDEALKNKISVQKRVEAARAEAARFGPASRSLISRRSFASNASTVANEGSRRESFASTVANAIGVNTNTNTNTNNEGYAEGGARKQTRKHKNRTKKHRRSVAKRNPRSVAKRN